MDWIGDKLSMLIEQGKRALNAEVVVMSDAKEDEVDDGSGGWEEEEKDQHDTSRSGSLRHSKRPRSILPPSSSSSMPHASSSSPRYSIYDSAPTTSTASSFFPGSAPGSADYTTPRRTHSRGLSYETGLGLGALNSSPSFTEDPSSWESPEIRESMEKARLRYLGKRNRD